MKFRARVIFLWTNTSITFIFTACGGELTGEGVIRSPFYPNVYPGERTCRWTIHQPQSQIVLLNFTGFDLGSSSHCDTDYIEVKYFWIFVFSYIWLKILWYVIFKSVTRNQPSSYRPLSLMNIVIKILRKMLANWIQQDIKRIVHHNQVGFVSGLQGCYASKNQLI